MTSRYRLCSFVTCPWVQRAAIVLREKQVPYEISYIDPDNRPDWFLAISPHKKVPVLRVNDDITLFESNAIAEYLDEAVRRRALQQYVSVLAGRATVTGIDLAGSGPLVQ